MLTRRAAIAASVSLLASPSRADEPASLRLVRATEAQIGRTLIYDPAYVRIPYPGGDVPIERGVCSDVVVRAYRDALGLDLQRLVHEDMRSHFSAYPTRWGLTRPDPNIDHRRVLNLQVFLKRRGAAQTVTQQAGDYRPGDLVTMTLPGNLPHIVIVSASSTTDGVRPLVIHNIGAGTRREDTLFSYPLTGHYRYTG